MDEQYRQAFEGEFVQPILKAYEMCCGYSPNGSTREMTHALLVGFGIACVALGFIAAWVMRSRECAGLETEIISARVEAESANAMARKCEENWDRWRDRAIEAEAELARLPKRVAGGQFAKRT